MLLHLTNGDAIANKPHQFRFEGASHVTQWPKVQTEEHNYHSQTEPQNNVNKLQQLKKF